MRKNRRRSGNDGGHVYHFAIFSLLIFTITLLGTMGIAFTGAATAYRTNGPYTLDSLYMMAAIWILGLAFLIPAELMIRNSRT